MAPLKAMKAMKAMKAKSGLTTSGAYSAVAATAELKPKQAKTIITNYIELAATELKKNGKSGWQDRAIIHRRHMS